MRRSIVVFGSILVPFLVSMSCAPDIRIIESQVQVVNITSPGESIEELDEIGISIPLENVGTASAAPVGVVSQLIDKNDMVVGQRFFSIPLMEVGDLPVFSLSPYETTDQDLIDDLGMATFRITVNVGGIPQAPVDHVFPITALAGTPVANTSLSFDGSLGQSLETSEFDTPIFDFHLDSGSFTVMVWAKPAYPGTPLNNRHVVGLGNGGNVQNRVWIYENQLTSQSSRGWGVHLHANDNPLGNTNKTYEFGESVGDEWTQIVITWANFSPGGDLTVYQDGVEDDTPHVVTTPDPDMMSMDNFPDMRASIGSEGNVGAGFPYYGLIHQVAIWDEELDGSAISTLYNNGNALEIDLLRPKGAYKEHDRLQHWYRPGETASQDMGMDFRPDPGVVDISFEVGGITSSMDQVADAPDGTP